MRYRCSYCNSTFDADDRVEVDHGGWEEFWGAKVWHHQYVDVSPCCHKEDYEEVEDDE